jgi:uncharacterized membrane protein
MEILTSIGLVVPAGLNAYIPLLAVSLAQRFGLLELRVPFDSLGEWWAIAIISVLLVVEVLADKVPAVDHANDLVQTVLRPAAGGVLFFATTPVASKVDPAILVLAGIILAGGVHAMKSAARPVINSVTGGTATPLISTMEDITAGVTAILAILVPALSMLVLAVAAYLLVRAFLKWRRSATARTG